MLNKNKFLYLHLKKKLTAKLKKLLTIKNSFLNMNQFVKETLMGAGSARTANGAKSYASIGTALLDQFAKAGTYRGRDINEVFADQSALWDENPEFALRFPFYLRMITRKDNMFDGETTETVQRGMGARDEAFKRLLWIAKYKSDIFYQNLWVLPIVGSWKDLWVMLTMDDTLKKEEFFKVMAEGVNDDNHRDLVKKYMPRIRSNSKCNTEWAKKTNKLAKDFAEFAGWSPKKYRSFKSTGKAHEFQRYICSGLYSSLNFNAIPGKALLNLVSGKFLDNHGLNDTYLEWLMKQPVAKFNGYPYELIMKVKDYRGRAYEKTPVIPAALKFTVDKQFDNLIATAKSNNGGINGNVWCALDTSGSMSALASPNSSVRVIDVALGLGIYFSTLNEGAFHKNVIMFDDESEVLQLKGDFTDMYQQITSKKDAMGSTNFLSVVEEICRIRRENPNIPLEEYPTTLLVVSDLQFNIPVPNRSWWDTPTPEEKAMAEKTNYEAVMSLLRKHFPSEWVDDFKLVWWHVNSNTKDFPSNMDCGGTYNIGGFDGSIISLLLGGEVVINPETDKKVMPTMDELIEKALTQEVLNLLKM